MVTLADVFRAYVKPSLGGELVLRKRNVTRRSAKVIEVNEKFGNAKIAESARQACINAHKGYKAIRYVDGQRKVVDVCPIQEFRKYLRAQAKNAGLTKYTVVSESMVTVPAKS